MAGYFRPGKASVIVGGQFGSEAKGLAAAYFATNDAIDDARILSTTNAGAQAGHTTILPDGRKFVCFHLPTVGVMLPGSSIYLNAGSIIDIDAFVEEVATVASITGESEKDLWDRITVHPNAAVICSKHKTAEAGEGVRRIGSTQKGVGEALVSKIRRETGAIVGHTKVPFAVDKLDLNRILTTGSMSVSVEVPQGTGLSINASPFYPNTTSRDCWVGQGLTDAGIHPSFIGSVAMVCRTFPIRVGNIYSAEGDEIGYSGPFYGDSREMDWAEFIGVSPEKTTVTKRIRRIASWSDWQYGEALRLNRPDFVFLSFTNYIYSAVDNISLPEFAANMMMEEHHQHLNPAHIYSWGPRSDQCSMYLDMATEESIRHGIHMQGAK